MNRLLLCLCLVLTGCPSWWQKLHDDPVAALQDGLGYFRTAISLATQAFGIWSMVNPTSAASMAPQFNGLITNVNLGLNVAQDGLHLAADAHGAAPDPNVLLRDAQAAMANLNSFLTALPPAHPGAAVDPTMLQALRATSHAAHLTY